MGIFEKFKDYLDSKELVELQKEWSNLKSHGIEGGIYVDDLIYQWNFTNNDIGYVISEQKPTAKENKKSPINSEIFFIHLFYDNNKESSIFIN